jgi:hypothetical protein
MLKSFPSYYLFLPMLIAWFGSYSYTRTWDLSWGNRPSSEMDAVSIQKKEQVTNSFKKKSRILIGIIAVLNLVLFLIPLEGQLILMTIFFILSGYQLTLSIIFYLINIFLKIAFIFKRCKLYCSNKDLIQSDVLNTV